MWNYIHIYTWDEKFYMSEKNFIPEKGIQGFIQRALSAPTSSAIPFLYSESKAFVMYDL